MAARGARRRIAPNRPPNPWRGPQGFQRALGRALPLPTAPLSPFPPCSFMSLSFSHLPSQRSERSCGGVGPYHIDITCLHQAASGRRSPGERGRHTDGHTDGRTDRQRKGEEKFSAWRLAGRPPVILECRARLVAMTTLHGKRKEAEGEFAVLVRGPPGPAGPGASAPRGAWRGGAHGTVRRAHAPKGTRSEGPRPGDGDVLPFMATSS